MGNETPPMPPRKRPLGVAFVLAAAGLLLLDGAAHLFIRGDGNGRASLLLVIGLAFLVVAVLWGTKRI